MWNWLDCVFITISKTQIHLCRRHYRTLVRKVPKIYTCTAIYNHMIVLFSNKLSRNVILYSVHKQRSTTRWTCRRLIVVDCFLANNFPFRCEDRQLRRSLPLLLKTRSDSHKPDTLSFISHAGLSLKLRYMNMTEQWNASNLIRV